MPALAVAPQPTAQHCCPTCGGVLAEQFAWDSEARTFVAGGSAVRFSKFQAKVFDAIWRAQRRGGIQSLDQFMSLVYSDDPEGGPDTPNTIAVQLTAMRGRLAPTGLTISSNFGNPRRGYRLVKIEETAR